MILRHAFHVALIYVTHTCLFTGHIDRLMDDFCIIAQVVR